MAPGHRADCCRPCIAGPCPRRAASGRGGNGGDAARGDTGQIVICAGILTGYEFEWLAAVMNIIRDQLPNTEVVILSQSSPDLAAGLTRGKIDLAFLRQERNAPGVAFNLLRRSGPASAGQRRLPAIWTVPHFNGEQQAGNRSRTEVRSMGC